MTLGGPTCIRLAPFGSSVRFNVGPSPLLCKLWAQGVRTDIRLRGKLVAVHEESGCVSMSNLLERLNQRFFSHRNKKVSSDALQTKTSSKWTNKSPNVNVGRLTLVCRELQDRNEALEARVVADELLGLLRVKRKWPMGRSWRDWHASPVFTSNSGSLKMLSQSGENLLLQEGRHGPASAQATSAMRFLAYTLRNANELSESLELDRRALLALEVQEGAGSKNTLSVKFKSGSHSEGLLSSKNLPRFCSPCSQQPVR